jgi:hypothetical protein
VPWGEFRAAFHGHHLSVGTMCHKLAEFLDLHQGTVLSEYIQEFINLAQYGSHHVDTDAKKAELFCKGLTIQLQGLTASTTPPCMEFPQEKKCLLVRSS